jgi:hypothetical protein
MNRRKNGTAYVTGFVHGSSTSCIVLLRRTEDMTGG